MAMLCFLTTFYSPHDGHWGLLINHINATTGRLYHVRQSDSHDLDKFFYEDRINCVENKSTGSYGRSVLEHLTQDQSEEAGAIIRKYASEDENIPRWSTETNCRTFVVNLLKRLGSMGVLRDRDHEFFTTQIGQKGEDIARVLLASGRSWILAQGKKEVSRDVDARYKDGVSAPKPGRLDINLYEKKLVSSR